MSEQNKTVLSPKTDTRKTQVNKGVLLFNRMGIWVITISLLILGTIIAAANGGEGTSAARTLVLDAGTSLELNGNTLVQPVVKGTGTVYGGTLKVTDKLVVKTGEMLLAGGTVDLDGAKVSLVDPENLSRIFTFLKAPNSQARRKCAKSSRSPRATARF